MKSYIVLIISGILLSTTLAFSQDLDEYLIAYWSFEDSTARDHSGNGYHGRIVNNPTPVLGVNGKGTAFHFQGKGDFAYVGDDLSIIGDHIELPRIPFENLGEFTISMWVKEDDLSQSHGEGYIWFGEHDAGWLGIFHNGYWMTNVPKASYAVGADLKGEDPLEIEYDYYHRYKWINFTLVYDGSILKAYRDGQFVGQKNQKINIDGNMAAIAAHYWHGQGHRVSARFQGSIDEVKIYQIALTDEEVEEEYESLCNQNNIIAHWSFDDGTAKDQSGNGYHGEVKNEVSIVQGVQGNALYLQGNSHLVKNDNGGHVMIPRIDLEYWNEFSISIWVKEDSQNLGGEAYFFMGNRSKNYLGIGNFANEDFGYDSLDLNVSYAVGSTYIPDLINNSINVDYDKNDAGRWVLYTLVFDYGEVKAYKNSELIGTKNQETVISSMNAAIGRHWWTDANTNELKTSTCFIGAIDEVKVYCKALSIKEIEKELLNCGEDYFLITNFNNSNTQLNGDARYKEDYLRLTESQFRKQGNCWYHKPVNVATGFETIFKFRIPDGDQGTCDPDGSLPGADGFAFIIQNSEDGLSATGDTDWGIGYDGIENSLAIEFDLYQNDEPILDPNGNHVAVQTNRKGPNTSMHTFSNCLSMRDDIMTIKPDGTVYYAKIDYNREPETLRIYLSEDGNFDELAMAVPNVRLHEIIDLHEDSKAFIGFTASTGNAWEAHDILEWEFCPFGECAPYEPEIMMEGDGTICEGDTVRLWTSQDYSSYEWSDGSTGKEMIATQTGTYHVTVIDEMGCPGTGTIFVNFNPKPDPEITVHRKSILCKGDSVILTTDEGYLYYEWREESKSTILSNDNELIVKESGKYYVIVRDENGCEGISDIIEITFSDMENGLEISGLSSSGVMEFDSTYFPEKLCKDIRIKNIADEDLTLYDVLVINNIQFSVPQAQFPLVLKAGETYDLKVCYSPLELGEARDTLVIEDFCSTWYIPLWGFCPKNIREGDSRCDVKTQVVTSELPQKGFFSASPPVPNPSSGIIEVDYVKSNDSDINCSVANTLGIKCSEEFISISEQKETESISSGKIRIDLSNYPGSVYYVSITNGDKVISYSVSYCK